MIIEDKSSVSTWVMRAIVTKPTEGRVLELTQSTTEQRKAISHVVSAIKAATNMSFDDIYLAAHGSMAESSFEDERNLPKGKIAHKKIAPIHRWIVEHHLPLACHIAPEVFDPSLLTRWRDFIREHGVYEKLTYRLAGEMGLTQRSRHQPIAGSIPMEASYLFDLDCGMSGTLLALESTEGHTYPFSLHPDQKSVLLDIQTGKQTLPQTADGKPDPLSEHDDKGLRSYVFVIGDPGIMAECAIGLREGHPIGLDKLDQMALAFKDIRPYLFEVHRLNVIFK